MNRTLRLILNLLLLSVGAPILVLLAFEPGWAANHYVRAAAAGTAAGSDWTNACTDFTGSCAVGSLVRGDTYYVATGTYATRTFNTAVSGTSLITIKGATAADHGTGTGWTASYGVDVTQAIFTVQMGFDTSYWVFDGGVGANLASTPGAYGFKIGPQSNCNVGQNGYLRVGFGGTLSNVTLKHLAFVGCGSAFDVQQKLLIVGCGSCTISNVTISAVYAASGNNNLQFSHVSNSTVEYFYSNGSWSSSANHGEGWNITCSTTTTARYSYWLSPRGTGTFAVLELGCNPGMDGWAIYGNVFADKSDGGDGVITTGDDTTSIKNTVIYNNTFVDNTAAWFKQCVNVATCPQASGNVLKNNLLYNSNGTLHRNTGGTINNDYNSYISGTAPNTETNGQIATFQPFVNYAGGNYYLANNSSVSAGVSLGAPYNTDENGRTRGLDGKWDRGAFEFTLPAPAAPQNLRVVP